MSRLKIRQQSLSKRCEICHQTDLFDAEKDVCLRCNALKDFTAKAYESSTPTSNNSVRILASGNIELMTLIQIGAIICSIIGIFIEIRTILLSGPILSAIGGVIACSSYRCKSRLGVFWGLSAILITLFCLSLILIFGWLPQDAETPIRIIAIVYSLLVLPLGITILLHLKRKNPNGTFSLKTGKNI